MHKEDLTVTEDQALTVGTVAGVTLPDTDDVSAFRLSVDFGGTVTNASATLYEIAPDAPTSATAADYTVVETRTFSSTSRQIIEVNPASASRYALEVKVISGSTPTVNVAATYTFE